MAEVVLPAQTNPLGKLLGGQVMHLVDMAAAMAASRHSNSYVVTASVDYIDFRNAVNLGELVILKSQDLSSYYATDFLQLWSRGKITDSTGYRDTGTAQVGRVPVTVAFTPGESATIVKDVVQAIEIARKRLVIAAMVMSSGARPGRRFRSD